MWIRKRNDSRTESPDYLSTAERRLLILATSLVTAEVKRTSETARKASARVLFLVFFFSFSLFSPFFCTSWIAGTNCRGEIRNLRAMPTGESYTCSQIMQFRRCGCSVTETAPDMSGNGRRVWRESLVSWKA